MQCYQKVISFYCPTIAVAHFPCFLAVSLTWFCFSPHLDLKDQEFLEEWDKRKLLASEKDGEKSRFMVPQVLIDGVSIGDGSALQDLEEDGDLGKYWRNKFAHFFIDYFFHNQCVHNYGICFEAPEYRYQKI